MVVRTRVDGQLVKVAFREGQEIRKGFHATKDPAGRQCLLASLDYSQIEMVMAGHMSGDKVLLDAFANNTDIHTLTAIAAFKLTNGPRLLHLCSKSMAEEMGEEPNWLPGEKEEWKVFKSTKRLPAKTVGFGILFGQYLTPGNDLVFKIAGTTDRITVHRHFDLGDSQGRWSVERRRSAR